MKFHLVYRISEHTLPLLGYVVRWKYCVKLTGVKTLKGRQSRYEDVGRDKVAYFFWQGKDSSLNEKGTAALMTVELDSDKGPQVPFHLLVPNETRTGNQTANPNVENYQEPIRNESMNTWASFKRAKTRMNELRLVFNFAFTWLRRWHWISKLTMLSRSLVHQLEALRHLKMQGKEKGKRANLKNDCLPGFGRARKGTSLFHEIVRRKDGCSLRKVSLSKTSLTNILPFGFPEISTNRVRSILEI